MHRSLTILEVFSIILSACRDSTLSALARTCRLFQDPALDLLWQHQISFPILVKSTVPVDQWDEVRSGWSQKILHFRRPLISTDLDVFNKYARRMTCVQLSYGDCILSRDVVEVLSQRMSPKPILPNLRKLFGHDSAMYDSYSILRLLLGPKVEVFHVNYLNHSASFIHSIHPINTLCPSLKSLRLKLGLSDLTVEQIDHIPWSGLARLTELGLVAQGDIMTVNKIVSLIRPYQLQKFHVMLDRPFPSMHWRQCFQTLSHYCSSTLRILTVMQEDCEDDGGTVDYIVGFTKLEPLLTVRHLKCLTLAIRAFDLGDDELEQMALAWPFLQKLDLQADDQMVAGTSRITLMGLVPTLKHCPDLRTLNLPINATIVDFCALETPGGVVPNHDITKMFVGDSPIEDSVAVAAFLSSILPNLQTFHPLLGLQSPYRSRWTQVPRLMLRKARDGSIWPKDFDTNATRRVTKGSHDHTSADVTS